MAKGILKSAELERWIKAGKWIAGKSDGGGLTFTLSKAGTASWVFRYRSAGKQREMTLGNYPDISLEKAREAARAARVMVDLGKDVAIEKRRAKAESAAASLEAESTEPADAETLFRAQARWLSSFPSSHAGGKMARFWMTKAATTMSLMQFPTCAPDLKRAIKR